MHSMLNFQLNFYAVVYDTPQERNIVWKKLNLQQNITSYDFMGTNHTV